MTATSARRRIGPRGSLPRGPLTAQTAAGRRAASPRITTAGLPGRLQRDLTHIDPEVDALARAMQRQGHGALGEHLCGCRARQTGVRLALSITPEHIIDRTHMREAADAAIHLGPAGV